AANFLLFTGFALLGRGRDRGALAVGIAALALSLTTVAMVHARDLLLGYYLWEASIAVFTLGAALAIARQWRGGRPRRASPPPPDRPNGLRGGSPLPSQSNELGSVDNRVEPVVAVDRPRQ